ncbi:kunitz-type protease inhibitor 1-like [Nothobranchius furzeri]|uniref:Kunitz-type protease inhibitor 1-like n=2 Tax=Nothobranchius furzeri TaxID=105023 RepID=A0A8C6KPR0_NOTFU|nr:kunitz-type protease inhibitor 1-like [Nothobranchius furzeri]
MSGSCSSSLLLLLLFLLLLQRGAEGSADCGSGAFRSGHDDFVLDTNEAVREGAALLTTESVSADADCETLCCQNPTCNLALLEPRAAGTRTCVLFDCIYKNLFVCRFVNQVGYQSYIRTSVYQKYLQEQGKQAPPIANAGRDAIIQPGETVLLNGSESLALNEAHITTYHWRQLKGDPGLTLEKTDHPDQVRLSNLKPGSYRFQLTVTDSKGQSDDDTVNVLVLNQTLSASYCLAPLKVGPCRAAFPRWRYNVSTRSCEVFTFGGCKSNENNYLSEETCQVACRGVTVSSERSIVLPAAEECGKACGPEQMTCDSGCCLDRSLECDGVSQCSDGSDESDCSELSQTFSQLLGINMNDTKVLCTDAPRTGPCRASHPRWYYDPLDMKCYRFTYGGCDGNMNNFEKEDECNSACQGVTSKNVFSRGIFTRYEKQDEEEGKSGSAALAVILAVAILALLAILGYCLLRRRRRSAATTRSAHTQLAEQDTLVYNSTTKPL